MRAVGAGLSLGPLGQGAPESDWLMIMAAYFVFVREHQARVPTGCVACRKPS